MRTIMRTVLLYLLLALQVAAETEWRPVTVLKGHPNPQDLTEIAWRAACEARKVSAQPMPPRYRVNAYYDEPNRIVLVELLPSGANMWLSYDRFVERNGRWYLQLNSDNATTNNIAFKNNDYVSKQLDFWDGPTAFPPVTDAAEARQLFRVLLAGLTDASRVRPKPSMKFDTVMARDEPRTLEAYRDVVRPYKDVPGLSLGITYVTPEQRVLWVSDGVLCSLFRFDGTGKTVRITDWYSGVAVRENQKAEGRVCTVSAAPPLRRATGGAGTQVPLNDLADGPTKQLLIRLFKSGKLNNRDEVLSYLSDQVAATTRNQWWPGFQLAAEQLKLADITATSRTDGRIEVSFPTKSQRSTLVCSLPSANRLRVDALGNTAVAQSSGETKARDLIRRALDAARQGDARIYCVPPNEIISIRPVERSDLGLLPMVKEMTGNYYVTTYRRYRVRLGPQYPWHDMATIGLFERNRGVIMYYDFQVDMQRLLISDWASPHEVDEAAVKEGLAVCKNKKMSEYGIKWGSL